MGGQEVGGLVRRRHRERYRSLSTIQDSVVETKVLRHWRILVGSILHLGLVAQERVGRIVQYNVRQRGEGRWK